MNRVLKLSFVAASLFALASVAAPADASTRTLPACIGMPGENVSLSLFTSHLGAITSNDVNDHFWTIPIVADQTQPFPGGFDVTIVGFAPSRTHNLSCSTRIVNADGVTFSGTALVQIPVIGSIQAWDPGSMGSLPSFGYAEVDCLMGQGSKVTNISY
jgi:hypothetical protein